MSNPLEPLIHHVTDTSYGDLPADAIRAAKIFILDTFSCGLAGSGEPSADATLAAAHMWGTGSQSRVWGRSDTLPPPSAAAVNAYQIHCLEYDCVHEGGVLHPMSSLMAALMAEVDRQHSLGIPISGQELIAAVAMGIDVSCSIALASTGPMRFFRPASVGGFGATAACAKLRNFGFEETLNAVGLQYGQTSGNMQAHVEGTKLLGLQVGFAARGGITSCDLAEKGIEGPKDVLTGMYGYLVLCEREYNIEPVWAEIGKVYRLTQVGHKPFPAGRLTHYVIDAIQILKDEHGFTENDVEKVTAWIPPLAYRLVGRPDIPTPSPSYARLCLPFVAAITICNGTVVPQDFEEDALIRKETHSIAAKIQVIEDNNRDPNAFGPQTVELCLKDGTLFKIKIEKAIGDPDKPLSRDRQIEKFWRCWDASANKMPSKNGEALVKIIDELEDVFDTAELTQLMSP